jgi:hypothetical protein
MVTISPRCICESVRPPAADPGAEDITFLGTEPPCAKARRNDLTLDTREWRAERSLVAISERTTAAASGAVLDIT